MIRCVVRAAALLSLCLPLLALASDDVKTPKVQAGDVPPESLGTTRLNDPVKTTDFPGKVLVTTFWASWSTACPAWVLAAARRSAARSALVAAFSLASV